MTVPRTPSSHPLVPGCGSAGERHPRPPAPRCRRKRHGGPWAGGGRDQGEQPLGREGIPFPPVFHVFVCCFLRLSLGHGMGVQTVIKPGEKDTNSVEKIGSHSWGVFGRRVDKNPVEYIPHKITLGNPPVFCFFS